MGILISILLFAFAGLYVTATIILFNGITGFSARLRRAYIFILIGFLLEAVLHTTEALATSLNWWSMPWFQVGQMLVYILAPLSLYVGVRGFGRLLQIKTLGTSATLTLGISLLLLGGVGYLTGNATLRFNFNVGLTAALLWLLIICTWVLAQIARQTSQLYQRSVLWLGWATGLLALGTSIYLTFLLSGAFVLLFVMILMFVVSGLMLLQAARKFYHIRGKNLAELKEAGQLTTSVDIISYVASLASKPQEIDPLLDDLRTITSKTSSGSLTSTDQSKLRQVYLRVEDYLAKRDPFRTYEPDMLRELITRKLDESNSQSQTFWSQLEPRA